MKKILLLLSASFILSCCANRHDTELNEALFDYYVFTENLLGRIDSMYPWLADSVEHEYYTVSAVKVDSLLRNDPKNLLDTINNEQRRSTCVSGNM